MFRGVEGATLMPGQKVVCVMDYRKPRADGVDSLALQCATLSAEKTRRNRSHDPALQTRRFSTAIIVSHQGRLPIDFSRKSSDDRMTLLSCGALKRRPSDTSGISSSFRSLSASFMKAHLISWMLSRTDATCASSRVAGLGAANSILQARAIGRWVGLPLADFRKRS